VFLAKPLDVLMGHVAGAARLVERIDRQRRKS